MSVNFGDLAVKKIMQVASTLQKVNPARMVAEAATIPITKSLKVGDYGATQMAKSSNPYQNTFGNYYTKQKQATSAGLSTLGRGLTEFGQSSYDYLRKTPYSTPEQNVKNLLNIAPSVGRTLMGAGQTVASVNPWVAGLRVASSTPIAQNINVNLPVVGKLNIPDTLTSMVEFTKDPAWKAIFPNTSKLLGVSPTNSKILNFLIQRTGKGSVEGLIQGWSTLPRDATPDDKVKHYLMNAGFGAASEITFDAFAKSIQWTGDKTKLKNIIVNLSDRISEDLGKAKDYATKPYWSGGKTRLQSDLEGRKFRNVKGAFNPEELGKTVKELQQEPQPNGVGKFYRTISQGGWDKPPLKQVVENAKAVEINPKISTYVYRHENGEWFVNEASTGLSFGNGSKTRKEAIDRATEAFSKIGVERIQEEVARKLPGLHEKSLGDFARSSNPMPQSPTQPKGVGGVSEKVGPMYDIAKKVSARDYLKKRIPEIEKIEGNYIYTKDGNKIELSMSEYSDGLQINGIQADKKATGIGGKIIEALQEWTTSRYGSIKIDKAYNSGFWKKTGFTGADEYNMGWSAGDKIYHPTQPKGVGVTKSEYPDSTNNPLYEEMMNTRSEIFKKTDEIPKTAKSDSDIPKKLLSELNGLKNKHDKAAKAWQDVYVSQPKGVGGEGMTKGKQATKLITDLYGKYFPDSPNILPQGPLRATEKVKVFNQLRSLLGDDVMNSNPITKQAMSDIQAGTLSNDANNVGTAIDVIKHNIHNAYKYPKFLEKLGLTKQEALNIKSALDKTGNANTYGEYSKAISKLPSPEGGMGAKAVQPETPQLKQKPIQPTSPLKTQPEKVQLRTKPKDLIQEATLKQSKVPEAKPLEEIISRSGTDVKTKVGFLDYLRTPDRVLKKIGLEKESTALRKAYDSYLTQLPKEIDKVTEWSKRLPNESNQRVFKYLDGQDVQLNPNEVKVAGEIRAYLDEWAEKLKLPKDKRISHYITHIFEKDFIEKEFDDDLAKILQDKVAGSVRDPFLEKRLGKMGYVEDTWRALDAYVKRATRKFNMDPALEMTKSAAKNLELSQYNYVKEYIDRINLRPTKIDTEVDNTIKQAIGYKLGQRPTALLTRAGRQAVYRGTLGLNPGTALKNLTQGANTYAKLGERYTLKGYWDIFTKGAKELEDTGVLKNNFIEDRTLSAGKQTLQKIDKGLFYFFELAEKINRGAAYFGAKAKALASGADEAAAVEAGKKLVRDTQFTFGSVDTPVAMQSDIVKLLTQFQSYSLKQTEFLGEMASQKDVAGLLRYGLASTAMVLTVGQLIGMEPKDIIPSFRIGLPPTLQTPIEIGKALLNAPDKYGNEQTTEEKLQNVGKSLIPFIPAGTQLKKTIGGLGDVTRGYSESRSGLVRYPVSKSATNFVRGGLFGANNLSEAQQYYDTKQTPLSEKQSQLFKQTTDKQELYGKIINTRSENKLINEAKKEVEETETGSKIVGSNIIYWDEESRSAKSIDVGKVTSMPESTSYEKLAKQKEAYKLVDNVFKLEKVEDQAAAFAALNISTEDASYYNYARQDNDLKSAYLNDEISKLDTSNRANLINFLIGQRKEINGKMVLSNGEVLDGLEDAGIISASEKTMLKNLKIVDGKPVTKLTGRGKKTTLKKVSLPGAPPKIKATSMKSLLDNSVKLKTKKYRFRRKL